MNRTNNKNPKSQQGFTLIEIMVVVAIIGLLMAAGLLSYINAQRSTRDSKRQSDIDAVSKSLELAASANSGLYPVAANYAAVGALPAMASYFPQGLPTDPKNVGVNTYTAVTAVTGYCVCAGLEEPGRGNATAVSGTSTCTFGAVAANAQGYFCVQNQQ